MRRALLVLRARREPPEPKAFRELPVRLVRQVPRVQTESRVRPALPGLREQPGLQALPGRRVFRVFRDPRVPLGRRAQPGMRV